MASPIMLPPSTGPLPSTHQNEPSTPTGKSELEILSPVLYPDDSYTPDLVYWADLPLRQKVSFVLNVDKTEVAKEWAATKALFKRSKFGPVAWYFNNGILPGAGLGLEGYVLFSIGNLEPLFAAVWPKCWKSHSVCNHIWVQSITYLEICGIIVGQILVGLIGDGIGRRFGLIQDAVIMFLGLLLVIGSWGVTLNGWVICYTLALFFYGIGVGGEYPMTATAAMENPVGSAKISNREDRLHRGRKVTMAFLMQGWGQFLNQAFLIILLLIFDKGTGNPPYSVLMGQGIFRISFVPIAIGTAALVFYRVYRMPLASKQLESAKKRANVTGYDIESLKLTWSNFGGRLVATAGSWYANDVFFYGNKLFQAQFIKVLSPGSTSILTGWKWNLCNVGVSLVGYYLASLLIDFKLYGRKRMMQIGFLCDFILFVVPAFNYDYFTSLQGIRAFQAMYFLSSFFNQFGPNSVTFLVAAEVFPTAVRASAHGFGAAVGKLGALTAAVLYNYIDTKTKFLVVPWFGLLGMVLTWLFLPDTTGLDLKEQERWWTCIRENRVADYHGVAINKQHLSYWEIFRGVHKHYDPLLDRESRIAELKRDWLEMIQEQRDNEEGDVVVDVEQFPPEVHEYMKRLHHVDPEAKGLKKRALASEKQGQTSSGGSEEETPASSAASAEVTNEKGDL